MPSIAKDLKDARQFLVDHDWHQGDLFLPKEASSMNSPGEIKTPVIGCCLVGACYGALDGTYKVDNTEARQDYFHRAGRMGECLDAATKTLTGFEYSAVEYNDRVCKSKEDALKAFDLAIERSINDYGDDQ